jgi:hypothetical protein
MRSVVVSMCVFLGTRIAQPESSGCLKTFSWSSGSRNVCGEIGHSDALTSACLLSLKGSVASSAIFTRFVLWWKIRRSAFWDFATLFP